MIIILPNLNNGHPYIISGDSQGSRLLGMVLGEYMKVHPEYYANMICAYRIGDSMTHPYLVKYPHVRPAQGADDLSVCISWNTEGTANIGRPSLVIAPEAVVIIPAPKMSKYSVTESQGEAGKMFEPLFNPASFHNCDYGFFYYNIQENEKLRLKMV